MTALHVAVENNNYTIVQHLLSSPAININDIYILNYKYFS